MGDFLVNACNDDDCDYSKSLFFRIYSLGYMYTIEVLIIIFQKIILQILICSHLAQI